MTSEDLLSHARSLLDNPTKESISGWPRAVALLGRMALETRLNAYWDVRLPQIKHLDMRAQLNCARVYLGPAVAGELSFAWHGLSCAIHHRPYELDPTAEELRSLLVTVERGNDAVAEAARRTLPATSLLNSTDQDVIEHLVSNGADLLI